MQTDLRRHTDLIAELDTLFPLRNPNPSDTLDTIRYNSGCREVVELLKRELADQEAHNSLFTGNDNV